MAKSTDGPETTEAGTSQSLAVITDPEEAIAALIRGEAVEAADPIVIDESIARRILYAETEEEAFADISTWSTQDNVGKAYEIHGCAVLRSAFGEGDRGYVVAQATDLDTGEVGVLTTGSVKIGSKLLWLRLNDGFPRKVRIRQNERPTANGFYPLDIETVE